MKTIQKRIKRRKSLIAWFQLAGLFAGLSTGLAVSLFFALTSHAGGHSSGHQPSSHHFSGPVSPQSGPVSVSSIPCGVLESFAGEIQLLDPKRMRLAPLNLNAPLLCQSWTSTNGSGWAQTRHRNGVAVHLGPNTLVQWIDYEQNKDADHLILLKGQVYVRVGDGSGEFRVASATGRVRLNRGKVIVSFDQEEDKTQVTVLENTATLENRFESSRKVQLHAGELSELDFKLMRVIPLLPKPVAVASLRSKIQELRVSERDQLQAERAAQQRQDRQVAMMSPPKVEPSPEEVRIDHSEKAIEKAAELANRKLASEQESQQYLRHAPSAEDAALRAHAIRKLAGGEVVGEKILYPDQFYGRAQRLKVEVEDVDRKFKLSAQKAEEAEKKRIIEELTEIRVE